MHELMNVLMNMYECVIKCVNEFVPEYVNERFYIRLLQMGSRMKPMNRNILEVSAHTPMSIS